MTTPNHFELLGRDGRARTGRLTTPHGTVRTPAFMPVGTAGAMKGLHWHEVRDAGSDIVLGIADANSSARIRRRRASERSKSTVCRRIVIGTVYGSLG
jgi:tRNA-guanine family transglycosylase